MPSKCHGYDDDHMAVLCAGYTKNPEDGLWYFWREVLPPPLTPVEKASCLRIQVTLDAEPDEFPDMVREKYVPVFLTFETGDKVYQFTMQCVDEWTGWMKFIQDITYGKDSRLGPIEYSEDSFHVWHVGDSNVRFVVQNGKSSRSYGRPWTDEKYSPSGDISPWAYAIDIEISRNALLSALHSMAEDMRSIISTVFAPAACSVFDEPLPQATATIIGEHGRKHDYFAPYRWVSAECGHGYENIVLPHMKRLSSPPHDHDFNVQIHAEGEYFLTLSHKRTCIGLLMPEWTHWEERLCEWLNLLIDDRGWGTVCFNTQGIDAILSAESDNFHIVKNPKADKNYLNFLVWATGSWPVHSMHRGYDGKNRVIHIKIERNKLVRLFYDVLQYILRENEGSLPKTPGKRLPFDLSAVESYLAANQTNSIMRK